ncbi:MAG: ATP-binding protein [Myxococcaceae bacterium]
MNTTGPELAKLFDGGAMGATMREVDWSRTPLGPPESWTPALRTMVGLLLRNHSPMLLWWGERFVQLYNDAYRPVLGAKHPRAMGQPVAECWKEIISIIGPMIERPFRGGPASVSDDLDLLLDRNGFIEEAHFAVAYSPVPDETVQPTGIGGVLATVTETTEQIYAQRQLQTLRDLSAFANEASTAERACELAAEALGQNRRDVPFALLYLLDEGGQQAHRVSQVGCEAGAPAAFPERLELSQAQGPVGRVLAGGASEVFDAPPGSPCGAWATPPREVIAVPLASADKRVPFGALVCGLSPHRRADERYRSFFELASSQVATAIRNARAFQEERRRAAMLAELDQAKTTFFSNVSHEFRTPLTLMLAPTEDLLAGVHGELSAEQRSQLELLRRNELRLQRLVNALLEFSRIEAGRTQATYQPTDLGALTRDLASSFRAAVERAGLKFTVECPEAGEPAFVDRVMWEQLVLNLLSNAFKFTFEGEIALRLCAAGKDWVLEVSDTGVGVRPEEVPRLFERFHRVEGSRARTHEGSGIGLALVQELAKLHGGSVSAQSRFGEGTTFKVVFPRGFAHLPAGRVKAERPQAPAHTATAFVEEALRWLPEDAPPTSVTDERPLVLVADDNADMRTYLSKVLGNSFRVETATDGGAALSAAKARRPALIVSDVMMPVLDGFRLLKALAEDERTRSIPVVMLSARAGEEARLEGLNAGAADYLVKPFSAKELLARVSRQLSGAAARRALEGEVQRLASVVEDVPASICLLEGPEHVFRFANRLCARNLLNRPHLGRPIRAVVPEREPLGFFPALDRAYLTGETQRGSELKVLWEEKDGAKGESWFDYVFQPVRDARGEVWAVLSCSFDVSERVEARRRTEEHRRAAEQAAKMRDEFLSIASHELRTPLTTLGLQLDGLVRDLSRTPDLTGERKPYLERTARVREQSERLEDVIDGMMDVFELGSAQGRLSLERVDLADVAKGVLPRFQPRAHQPRPPIQLFAAPCWGFWDRRRLEQIVSQLLSNAVKFGGGKPIALHVGASPGASARTRLTVVDAGIGIALADQERIFSRFGRAASVRNYGGFGMGLWIVRELVTAMKGTVEVASEPGKGATFTVELPGEA